MLTSSSRLRYHYENILRQDLLLKLNYSNIMEVPQLCKINISSQVPLNSVKNVSLALEIICGQKFLVIDHLQTNKNLIRHRTQNTFQKTSIQRSPLLGAKSKRGVILSHQGSLFLAKATLRSTTLMFNFLEKLITLISFYDYTIQFQANTIQITIGTQMRLFPEIQNHFEFFENIQNLNVFIVTTALTEKETQLLWTGLNQKEF
jgi:ribosomal protein L5